MINIFNIPDSFITSIMPILNLLPDVRDTYSHYIWIYSTAEKDLIFLISEFEFYEL